MSRPVVRDEVLLAMAMDVRRDGPWRVIINAEGEGVPPRRARENGVTPDVVFLRADGWSLGAPFRFEAVAERLYREEWVGVMRRPDPDAAMVVERYPLGRVQ